MITEHTPFTDEGHCQGPGPTFAAGDGCVFSCGAQAGLNATVTLHSLDFSCTRPRKGCDVKFLIYVRNKY